MKALVLLCIAVTLGGCASTVKEAFLKQNLAVQDLIADEDLAQAKGDTTTEQRLGKTEQNLDRTCRSIQEESVRRMDGEPPSPFFSFQSIDMLMSAQPCTDLAEHVIRNHHR